MLVSWNERPMPSLVRAEAGSPVTSRPLKCTRPSVGRYWPLSRLKKVVLPAPLGPMMDFSVRGAMSSVTWSTATWPPKRMVRSRVEMTGGSPATGPPYPLRKARRAVLTRGFCPSSTV